MPPAKQFFIPYIDQPTDFWRGVETRYKEHIAAVYFPIPAGELDTGRPRLPDRHLETFLRWVKLPKSVLVNPLILRAPFKECAAAVLEGLERLVDLPLVRSVTVADVRLARAIRQRFPHLRIQGSVLADIHHPCQMEYLEGAFDGLVAASRIMRDLPALLALKQAFPGELTIIVNEGCLPGCPYRTQHFYDMGRSHDTERENLDAHFADQPWLALSATVDYTRHAMRQLCDDLLARKPWLRLTGAWVLPAHLHLFDETVDRYKIAGRSRLRDPETYLAVLEHYVRRLPTTPDRIGGGPAAPVNAFEVTEAFYRQTLSCGRHCHACEVCREYHRRAVTGRGVSGMLGVPGP